jgi:hypothetical protein
MFTPAEYLESLRAVVVTRAFLSKILKAPDLL